MNWNYRLVRRRGNPALLISDFYGIHEAYYDAKTKSRITSITDEPIGISGDTVEEIRSCYSQIAEAFTQPIIDYQTRKPIRTQTKKAAQRKRK